MTADASRTAITARSLSPPILPHDLGRRRIEIDWGELGNPREDLVAGRSGERVLDFAQNEIRHGHSRERRARLQAAVHVVGHIPNLKHSGHVTMMFAC